MLCTVALTISGCHSSMGGLVTPQLSGPLCRGKVGEGPADAQKLWLQAPEQATCHPH